MMTVILACIRRRLRRLHDEGERGVVIVIVAASLAMFLASGAYALDTSQGRAGQQKAQSAADAAALAAADAIPANNTSTNVPTVTTAGVAMAAQNMPGAAATITMPTPTTVQATVNGSSSNPIGLAGGNSSTPVSASAGAASKNVGGTPGAIFASASACGGLSGFPGVSVGLFSSLRVNGNLTTNGSVTSAVFAGISVSGTMTYGCLTGTLLAGISTGATVAGPNNAPYPLDYASTYPNICTSPPAGTSVITVGPNLVGQAVVDNSVLATASGPTIFCSSWPMQITATVANTGAYTFVAPSLSINVASVTFTPALPSLPSFWATTGGIVYALAGVNSGTVYAPNGNIGFTLAGATITGYLEAQQVNVGVSGVVINGNGPTTGGTQQAVLTS